MNKQRVTNEQAEGFSKCNMRCEKCRVKVICYDFTGQATHKTLALDLLDARKELDEAIAMIREMYFDLNSWLSFTSTMFGTGSGQAIHTRSIIEKAERYAE